MADDADFVSYPQGQVAIGNGEAQHLATAKFSKKNNAKLQHTLRRSPSGYTKGITEVDGSLEFLVPATGPEIDALKLVSDANPMTMRFKMPGTTVLILGVINQADVDIPIGDAVKISANFIGAHRKT